MSDTDKVAVQYEVKREDVERIIRLKENGLRDFWDFFDEVIKIARTVTGSAPLSAKELARLSGIEDLNERFEEIDTDYEIETQVEIDNSNHKGELTTKLDIFTAIGLIQQSGTRNAYKSGPLLEGGWPTAEGD